MFDHAGRGNLGIDKGHATHDTIPLKAGQDTVFGIDPFWRVG
jgi:hypothetical protein